MSILLVMLRKVPLTMRFDMSASLKKYGTIRVSISLRADFPNEKS